MAKRPKKPIEQPESLESVLSLGDSPNEMPVENLTQVSVSPHDEIPFEGPPEITKAPSETVPMFGKLFKNIKLIAITGGVFLVFAGLVCTAAFFYFQYQHVLGASKKMLSTTTMTKAQELQDLLSKLGKIAEIPANETPTIATVSDITKLKNNPFFSDAENGDKVFIFQSTGKAYLFRPSTDKVININSVNFVSQGSSQASSDAVLSASEKSPNVVILNGTTVPNLTISAQKKITDAGVVMNVLNRADANNNYDTSIVVDLSGTHPKDAQKIANAVHGTVGALPNGETATTSADILVILGINFTQ